MNGSGRISSPPERTLGAHGKREIEFVHLIRCAHFRNTLAYHKRKSGVNRNALGFGSQDGIVSVKETFQSS